MTSSGVAVETESVPLAEEARRADHQTLNIVIGLEGLALGGCPINAIDLGRTLRERGHRISMFAIDEATKVSLLPVAERAGFEVTVFPADGNALHRVRQIKAFSRAADADIIHSYGPWLGPATAVAAAGPRRRAAVVTNWTMENVDYTPPGVTLIVGTKDLQVEAEGWHRGPVELLEPPVDVQADSPDPAARDRFRADWGIADQELAVVVVSRLDTVMKAECIGYAMNAIRRLRDPRWRLVVVGDGNARESLERAAADVNADLDREAVVLTGALHDPRPAYDAADIALCMGGSALRALAHAKPLIVPGVNGFARIFEPTTVEYFYEQGFFGTEAVTDPVEHLASLLSTQLDDSSRAELADFGLAEVRRRFSLEVGAARLEAIYRTALGASGGRLARQSRGLLTAARLCLHEGKQYITSRITRRRG